MIKLCRLWKTIYDQLRRIKFNLIERDELKKDSRLDYSNGNKDRGEINELPALPINRVIGKRDF